MSTTQHLPDAVKAPDAVDESRRDLLKLSLATGAAALVTGRASHAQTPPLLPPPSPPVQPWAEAIPAYTYQAKPTVSALTPVFREEANTAAGECGRADHQRFDEIYARPHEFYELHVREAFHTFNPAYPAQPIWGFDGQYPGPTFHARYGTPACVRLFNELPPYHVGYGTPEISVHLHNLHAASESDGFPGDFWSATKKGPTLTSPGRFKDHLYPNLYAGIDAYGGNGDYREALGTLWYHDHTMAFTAPNVVKGLAGFYILYDDLDSGNEQYDPNNPNALRLPSGNCDVPLIFQDMRFDSSGYQTFDQLSTEGTLGDQVVVNGKIKPFLNVARRKYRFRLLNGGPSRFYEFYLLRGSTVTPFTYIANDGNLLPAPLLSQSKVRLGVAERADIIVDFKNYPAGTELYLVNRLRQEKTRLPKDIKTPGDQILKFKVVGDALTDPSQVPTTLRPMPYPTPEEIAGAVRRTWNFDRSNGMWTINGQIFNVNSVRAKPKHDRAEIWTFRNLNDGWSHPIHVHFEEGQILSKTKNGVSVPIPAHERGRKDVFVLNEISSIEVFYRFRDFKGKYVMHCHNVIHEDHEMMLRFDVET